MTPSRAGFVLAGGRSSRMGRDKALLETGDSTLVQQVADRVRLAAGDVTVIGPPERYERLGLRVIGDEIQGSGPIGGLYTALRDTSKVWNLLVACDMPDITPDVLRELLEAAEHRGRMALVPWTRHGTEPLCAVYHRELLPHVAEAIDHKLLKMQDFVSSIGAALWYAPNPGLFRNINTLADWIDSGVRQ